MNTMIRPKDLELDVSGLLLLGLDYDGTLGGLGGSLHHDLNGNPSVAAGTALKMAAQNGMSPLLVSGRKREEAAVTARVLGTKSYIADLGATLCIDGNVVQLTGTMVNEPDNTIHQQIERSGALAEIYAAFPGALESHDPWNKRELTQNLRGNVSVAEVQALLDERFPELAILDNGTIEQRHASEEMRARFERVHSYHVLPKGVSKAAAFALATELMQLDRSRTVHVGDGEADAALADVAGAVFIVGNGWQDKPDVKARLETRKNVLLVPYPAGQGVLHAVDSLVAWRPRVQA